jgi:hypothetical protein
MLDIARAIILVFAIVRAVQGRFVLGIVFGTLAALAMGAVGYAAFVALARHDVSGEYGFAFVYVGPTMLPLGGRLWFPVAMQLGLTAVTLVPTIYVLRTPASRAANAFLLVFVPNAILAVMSSFGAFLMWRQERAFPEYWENPSLAGGAPPPSYVRLSLRSGHDEGSLVSTPSTVSVALLVRNHWKHQIHLIWLDATGRRDARPDALDRWLRDSADPGIVIEERAWPGEAFVITDDHRAALCTFVVGVGDAMVDFDSPCQ